jgi:hypothetical protein
MIGDQNWIGAGVAIILALLGWIQSAARISARLRRAEKDIFNLQERSEKDDDLIKRQLAEMDRRREGARNEIADFRERISRELGEIHALLKRMN